jgi:transposase, IS5 family
MSDTADFFRARLDEMVDMKHPLVVLSKRLPWGAIEQALAPHFARKPRPGEKISVSDLLGEHQVEVGTGISPAGRPRLGIRLMASLQCLKNTFNRSDEELVLCWSRQFTISRRMAILQRHDVLRAPPALRSDADWPLSACPG